MKITVDIKTNCSNPSIEIEDGIYTVRVKAKPHKNAANIELIESLSKYFNLPKTSITILKGHKGRRKIILLDQF